MTAEIIMDLRNSKAVTMQESWIRTVSGRPNSWLAHSVDIFQKASREVLVTAVPRNVMIIFSVYY